MKGRRTEGQQNREKKTFLALALPLFAVTAAFWHVVSSLFPVETAREVIWGIPVLTSLLWAGVFSCQTSVAGVKKKMTVRKAAGVVSVFTILLSVWKWADIRAGALTFMNTYIEKRNVFYGVDQPLYEGRGIQRG